MTKPTKWLCAQRRLRSAWASTQSDAQADLSLRWVHSHIVGFVIRQLISDHKTDDLPPQNDNFEESHPLICILQLSTKELEKVYILFY